MSNRLRDDNECQNCGHAVEVAFCSKCGQKNVETRQTFPRLVGHFAEDLTHYDTAFWRTLRDLLLKPGRVVKTYLEGRRQCYVPPVKLYIFVSFVTFFILALVPADATIPEDKVIFTERVKEYGMELSTVKEFDSLHNKLPAGEQLTGIPYYIQKARVKAYEDKFSVEDLKQGMVYIFPKVLFFYMPFFTFWLWLIHGKKRWYFFDHAIYTLYNFSFLLLLIAIHELLDYSLVKLLNENVYDFVNGWITFIFFCYAVFYLFRSHSRMYRENRWISRLKSATLFFCNMFCIFMLVFICIFYVILNSH